MVPSLSLAADYVLLAPISGVHAPVGQGFAGYAQELITFIIGFAAVLAVLMIVYGGFMYMTGEAIDTKGHGKEVMLNAIYGLLLLLVSWLILNTINPQLLNLNVNLSSANAVRILTVPTSTAPHLSVYNPVADCKAANKNVSVCS
jgi:type IV secretory pathway VirB2 component (pilin)